MLLNTVRAVDLPNLRVLKGMCNFKNPCYHDGVINATCSIDPGAPIIGAMMCTCPKGYQGDGRQDGSGCFDLDECRNPSLNVCVRDSERCVNTVGSYYCECQSGYMPRPDGEKGCVDVNECEYPTLHTCHASNQICRNLPGSYECVCAESGYLMDRRTGECQLFNMCTDNDGAFNPCDKVSSNCIFDEEEGRPTCVCKEGFREDPNHPERCLDIDECADPTTNECDLQISFCENIPGSYRCVCDDILGFTQSREDPRLKCTNLNECEKWPAICGELECCKDLQPRYPPVPFSGFACAPGLGQELPDPAAPTSRQTTANNRQAHAQAFLTNSLTPMTSLPRPHNVPPPPSYSAHLLRPKSVPPLEEHIVTFVPDSTPMEISPSMLRFSASKLDELSRQASEDSFFYARFANRRRLSDANAFSPIKAVAFLSQSVPLFDAAGLALGDAMQTLSKLGTPRQCPAGFINIHAKARERARERTAETAMGLVAAPFQMDPTAFGNGIVQNTELIVDDIAKWAKTLAMAPMAFSAAAQNLTSMLIDPQQSDVTKLIRATAGIGNSLMRSATQWGTLFGG